MQAIITKYLPPTNHKGSRIKATAFAGSIIIDWDDEFDISENHLNAAVALCDKFNWSKVESLVQGALPNTTGYAFVFRGE